MRPHLGNPRENIRRIKVEGKMLEEGRTNLLGKKTFRVDWVSLFISFLQINGETSLEAMSETLFKLEAPMD